MSFEWESVLDWIKTGTCLSLEFFLCINVFNCVTILVHFRAKTLVLVEEKASNVSWFSVHKE